MSRHSDRSPRYFETSPTRHRKIVESFAENGLHDACNRGVRSADLATISSRTVHAVVRNHLGANSLTGYMPMSWPPQTLIACPVMKSASLEHRNATAFA